MDYLFSPSCQSLGGSLSAKAGEVGGTVQAGREAGWWGDK